MCTKAQPMATDYKNVRSILSGKSEYVNSIGVARAGKKHRTGIECKTVDCSTAVHTQTDIRSSY